MSARAKRIILILVALAAAHIGGSYVCMYFTTARIDQVTSMTLPKRVVHVRRLWRYGAPVYLPQTVNLWRQVKDGNGERLESSKGLLLIALAYLFPAAGIFTLVMLSPMLLLDDDEGNRKRRARAHAAASAPAAAPDPAVASGPPLAAPAGAPPPVSRVQPPPPSRPAIPTPPPPARTTPPPPRSAFPTPPPPARTTPPPPRRPS